jgi:hypothetical protein
MQTTNIASTKVSDLTSKVIAKLMLIIGAVGFVWILIFLLVAMIEK